MAAHSYWALFFPKGTSAGGDILIAEVVMRASIGGANLCVGGSALASSVNSGATPASAAFDGSTSTSWQSGSGVPEHRLSYAFPSAVSVAEVAVTIGSNSILWPPSAVLAYSDDGSAWTRVGPAFALTQANAATTTVSGFGEPQTGQAPGAAARLSTEWGTAGVPSGVAKAPGSVARVDPWCGPGAVSGDVAIDGTTPTPVRRRVLLLDRASGLLIRETWSDAETGAYTFPAVRDANAIVLAIDHTRAYNAVVADAIDPTP